MNIVSSQTGIDVAKDELVVSIDQGKSFGKPNTAEGCREIIELLPAGGAVHIEATGGYERLLRRMLTEAQIKVVLHNPLKAKRMAQAQGTKAKTDSVDAKSLSQSGALLPAKSVKSTDRQGLADFSRAIEALRDVMRDHRKRAKMPELDDAARQLFENAVLHLEKQVLQAEKAFEARVKASDQAQTYKNIQSVPSLGKAAARICVCEFPEDLAEVSPSQIASYAGLAPIDSSSGKGPKKAKIGRGNSRLKACFYMPAITALRQEWARTLYDRLRAKGHSHDKAIVPIMRRLLIRAVVVAQRGTPWIIQTSKA